MNGDDWEARALLAASTTILLGVGSVATIGHFRGKDMAAGFLLGCLFVVFVLVANFSTVRRR